MIKALFPNIDFKRGDFYIIPLYHDDRGRLVDAMGCCRGFEIDWWDAPYGREENKK